MAGDGSDKLAGEPPDKDTAGISVGAETSAHFIIRARGIPRIDPREPRFPPILKRAGYETI